MTGLRWGILGTGWIAELQTSDLKLDGHTVTAVGSRAQRSADAFGDRFGIPNRHGSYADLVADPDVDIVYVATPHPMHAADAKLALQAGKHVLVEKPFTINQAEAQSVVDLAASKGLVVLEAMWTRWLPHMLRVRELLADGALGTVQSIVVDHTQKISSDPAHRINALELGGGALLDLGIYPVSFAWDLFGAPATIQAIARMGATGADKQTSIVLGYASGQHAVMTTASDTAGPNTASIMGTDGYLVIDRVWYNATSFTRYDSSGQVVERFENTVPGRGMQFQARAIEQLIEAGQTVGDVLPPSESVAIIGTLDAIRKQIGLSYPTE